MTRNIGILVLSLLSCHWTMGQRANSSLVIQRLVDTTMLGPLIQGAETADISDICKDGIKLLGESLDRQQPWAMKMLDASGKVSSNVNSGRWFFGGTYHECSKVKVEKGNLSGKFCSATFMFDYDFNRSEWKYLPYTMDVCVPSVCSDSEIFDALYDGLSPLGLQFYRPSKGCYVEKEGVETKQIVAILILSILVLCVFIGTAVDLYRRHIGQQVANDGFGQATGNRSSTNVEGFFTCFSLYKNAVSVLRTDSPGSSLTALNGIRFLSTTWIILYHCFYHFSNFAANAVEFNNNRFRFAFQVVLNGLISVDTFFLLGGLLVVYTSIRKLRETKQFTLFDYFTFFVHRFWRLTPPIVFAILIVLIWPLLGSGPIWAQYTNPDYNGCSKNWFSNLFYINNFYGLKLPCMDHLWYLANDMQFYLLSPAVFYLLYKHPRSGLLLNAAILVMSIVVSFVLGAVYNLQATTLFYLDFTKLFDGFEKVYTKPYCRVGPYCLGMFLGYLLATKKTINMNKSVQGLGWALSFACCFSTVYGVYNWNQGHPGNRYVNALYLALHRSVWALGVGWVCLACATGHGGIVNRILSWKAFVPLSKLTYVTYIIHPLVVKGLIGIQSERMVLDNFLWTVIYVGIVAVSFALAFPITLCIEVPFVALEKIIFPCLHTRRPCLHATEDSEPISIISTPNYNAIQGTSPKHGYNGGGMNNEGFAIENDDDSQSETRTNLNNGNTLLNNEDHIPYRQVCLVSQVVAPKQDTSSD